MNDNWALSLPRAEIAALATLRRLPQVEVCDTEQTLWLRGDRLDERLEQRLRMIPGAQRFAVLGDGQLRGTESAVPLGHLPAGPWTSLVDWMRIEVPPPAWPGQRRGAVSLTLVRGAASDVDESAAPTLLLTSLAAWLALPRSRIASAGAARSLDVCRRSRQRRVIVRGGPLPPLPGQRFIERGGLATPVGWQWLPQVDPPVVLELLRSVVPQLAPQDLALLLPDGSWEHIPGDSFVQASRGAIRLTAEGFHDKA